MTQRHDAVTESPEGEWRKARKRDQGNRQHVDELSASWAQEHCKRCSTIEADLTKQHGVPGADEKLLLHLAAHDAAIAEALGQSELQFSQRLLTLVDNAALGLVLAKTLKQVGACREGATRRVQELLQAAGVVRGQRKLAEVVPLRRVA